MKQQTLSIKERVERLKRETGWSYDNLAMAFGGKVTPETIRTWLVSDRQPLALTSTAVGKVLAKLEKEYNLT